MAGTLTNLEIFATGTHRASSGTQVVTDKDLDLIADAFDKLQGTNIVKPHLKLGHEEAQAWFGQSKGIPTLGWITKVWRQGSKLLADVTDVPDALIQLIKSSRFHNVSSEIFWNAKIEHEGHTFSRVLSAVALLGIEMPAVKDLAGLASALFQNEPIHQFTGEPATIFTPTEGDNPMPGEKAEGKPDTAYSQDQVDTLVSAAVDKAVKEATTKFEADTKSLTAEKDLAIERAEQAEGKLSEVKAAAQANEAETLVTQAIKDGKLLPKQKEFAMAVLTAKDVKIKFGDGEKSMSEIFKEFIGAQGKMIDLTESGDGTSKVVEYATVAAEVDGKTKIILADGDGKMDYADAMAKVFVAEPELKVRYAEQQN